MKDTTGTIVVMARGAKLRIREKDFNPKVHKRIDSKAASKPAESKS